MSENTSTDSTDSTVRRVAVAGGTGVVGRWVVDVLQRDHREVVVLSRSRGVDLVTGEGVDAALAGCHAVVDVSNVTTTRRDAAVRFFDTAARTLTRAAAGAGVQHLVALSIVGIDRVDLGYYAGKRRQEEIVTAGSVPWTVLRATQFHEFAGQLLDRSGGPVAVVPRMRCRPVAASEVAERLAALAVGEPQDRTLALAGPQEHDLVDLARRTLRARGNRRVVLPLRLPGKVGRQVADGGLLPDGPCILGTQTFDDWLAGPARDRQEGTDVVRR